MEQFQNYVVEQSDLSSEEESGEEYYNNACSAILVYHKKIAYYRGHNTSRW